MANTCSRKRAGIAPPGFSFPGISVPGPPGQSPSGPQRPLSVFPFQPTPGTRTVIRPERQHGGDPRPTNVPPVPHIPPPPPAGQACHALASPPITETVTQNQTEFRVCFRQHADSRFSMKDSMINYLSRLLDVTGYKPEDLKISASPAMIPRIMNKIQVTKSHSITMF